MQMIGSKGTRLAEGAMAAEGYIDTRTRGISVCVLATEAIWRANNVADLSSG